MRRRRSRAKPSIEDLEYALRSEMRRILRKWNELNTPLKVFHELPGRPEHRPKYQVVIDNALRPRSGEGLLIRISTITFPEERYEDKVLDFARAVWHLRDHLNQLARIASANMDINSHARKSQELLICADLINMKKHGNHDNQSGVNPRLTETHFDTSESGLIEFQYDGGLKEASILVEMPRPIKLWIDVYSVSMGDQDNSDNKIHKGMAQELIWKGFKHWWPLIDDLGILIERGDDNDNERKPIRSMLRNYGYIG